jgi:hypothetical protein
MGAAASIESMKPVDASDVRNSGDLSYARNEVIQLRTNLGKYALEAGYEDAVVYDASDLCKGVNEAEDFDRCVSEVAHIRQCLRLSTQGARRATRHVVANLSSENLHKDLSEQKNDIDSSTDSDDER